MRILVASQQWFPDYAGGTARVAEATARELANLGHVVVAVVPEQPGQGASISTATGVEVRRVMRRNALPQTITDVYEMRRGLLDAGARSFDVVLTHHPLAALAALSIKGHPPIAHVYHSSPGREARHRRALGLDLRQSVGSLGIEVLLRAYERIVLGRVDRIVVLSEFSRRLVEESQPGAEVRCAVVGGGVDVDLFAPASERGALRAALGVAAQETLVITVRRLVARMGLEVLLDAMALASTAHRPIKLVVIGTGELREELLRHRDDLGLAGSVEFVGRVSDEEVRQWYQAADVFVLPTIAYEGFGMVTVEALASGTPVVGTDVGATAEILAGMAGARVVEPDNAAAVAEAIGELSRASRSDPGIRALCRSFACERFAWPKVIKRWEAAIETGAAARRTVRAGSGAVTGAVDVR
jgi:glycosyltransferase involved in cell wall biosynthesis